jgi:signal peptidase II
VTLPPLRESGWRWLGWTLAVILLDQWSKGWIETNFRLYESIAVLPVLDITRLHNTGAAFSFLADAGGWQRWFFTGLAVAVSLGIVWWLRSVRNDVNRWLLAGLALILGGAIGNVIDRFQHGFVVDFVHAHWGEAYFPAFNVADAAITIGAAFVIIDALLDGRRAKAPPATTSD